MSDLQSLAAADQYITKIVESAGHSRKTLHTDAGEIAQTLRRAYQRSGMSEDEARTKSRAMASRASELYDALTFSMHAALKMRTAIREAQNLTHENTVKANIGTYGPMLD